MEIDDKGVLEEIGKFVSSKKIEIDDHAYESTFTVDTCFFGNKQQPYNKQSVINFQEKFEIIDYQLPEIPSSKKVNDEESFNYSWLPLALIHSCSVLRMCGTISVVWVWLISAMEKKE